MENLWKPSIDRHRDSYRLVRWFGLWATDESHGPISLSNFADRSVRATRTGALFINTLIRVVTKVIVYLVFFCYTAVNAFATVCSLSGDPVGSASPPHFLPAVFPALI